MVVMDAAKVKELTGLTYGQLNYLIMQVQALKREKTQGKARDFTYRDLVLLKLASLMRSDGIRLDEINQAIGLVNDCWNTDNPLSAGVLTRMIKVTPEKYPESINKAGEIVQEKRLQEIKAWSVYIDPILWMWTPDSQWALGDDASDHLNKYFEHIPKFVYSVYAIARDLSKVDQLELDIMSDEMAVA